MLNFVITFGPKNSPAGAFLAPNLKVAANTAKYLVKGYLEAAKAAGHEDVTKADFKLYPMKEVRITWEPTKAE